VSPSIINSLGVAPAVVGVDLTDLSGYRWDLQSHTGTFSDAARTTPVSAHGDPVRGWTNNNNTLGIHATLRAGTSPPTVDTATAPNGHRTLSFGGAAAMDLLTPFLGTEVGASAILVVKNFSAGGLHGLYNAGGGGDGIWYPEFTNIKDNSFSNARPDVGVPVLPLENWRAWIVVNSAAGKKIWLDATSQYTGNPGYAAPGLSTIVLGQSGNGGFMAANLAAAFFFGAKLSDAEAATAWSRIQTFYAL
jgi:hypothetical protein